MDKITQERGLVILREVIGEEYFKKREATASSFNKELRELAEVYCFGEVWARPGLERKTRSLLCIATLIALGKPAELRLHVSGAIRNGCTPEEIKEVLLQSVIYCGLPAAVDGLRVAEDALKESGKI
jgi:4-carboxymuconolactone decarboxylase